MVSSSTGYWIGSDGVYHTTTAGVSWQHVISPLTLGGDCLHFFDDNTGVVGGSTSSANVILYTANGGASWTVSYSDAGSFANNEFISQIVFPTSSIGYALVSDGKLLKSTNGGQNWTRIDSLPDGPNTISFPSASIGYVGTGSGLLKTINGGSTWSTVLNDGVTEWASFFVNDTTGYISRGNSIARTTDGGSHWSSIVTNTNGNKIFFAAQDTGFMVCTGSKLYYTYNGGLSWEAQSPPNYNGLGFQCVHFSGGTGVVGGVYGYLDNTTNYGGGRGKPIALCTRTSGTCDSIIQVANNSWTGYTTSWYFNKQYAGSTYNFTHVARSGTGYDTVQLVVSNGAFTDTNTLILPQYRGFVTPRMPVIRFINDTLCTAGYMVIYVDSTLPSRRYRVSTNGVPTGSFSGNNGTVTFQNFGNISGDVRITVTMTDSTNPCRYFTDSVWRYVHAPPVYRGRATLLDTIVCNNGIARIRIDSSSAWYTYNAYTAPVRGTGGTIYLYDTITTLPYTSIVPVTVTNETVIQCTLLNPLMVKDTVYVRWPRTGYTTVDSFADINDTIHLVNTSQDDMYAWHFDPTADQLSDTVASPRVVYHTPGEKVVTLIGSLAQHCGDTVSRYIYIAGSSQHDTSGGLCRDRDLDTTSYPAGGVMSYHVDRSGHSYTGGYEFCCPSGAGFSTATAAYLRKTYKNGQTAWYKNVPFPLRNNSSYYSSYINGITTDASGNVYIAGSFATKSVFIFDTMQAAVSARFSVIQNFFMAKFDSTGAGKWIVYSDGGALNSSGGNVGATDIKYVDDEHIYVSLAGTGGQVATMVSAVHYTDSIRIQFYNTINVLRINSRGQYQRRDGASASYPMQPLVFNPYPNTGNSALLNVIGPKLFAHDDCTVSLVGFFADSLSFTGAIGIHAQIRNGRGAFIANLDPDAGWLSAHSLFSSPDVVERGSIGYARNPVNTLYEGIDYIPRFDFDRDHNLYLTAAVKDTFSFVPTPAYILGPSSFPELQRYYMLVAKFDRNGNKIWHTKNRIYNSNYAITGVNLSPDQRRISLTGDYSGAAYLASTHQPPVMLHSGITRGTFLAAMDTAGDVKSIDNLGTADVPTAFTLRTGNGNLYTVGRDGYLIHEKKYNLYGNCNSPDSVAGASACTQGFIIALASGSMPVCDSQSCTFVVHGANIPAGSIFRWYTDGTYAGGTGLTYILPHAVNGQTLQCRVTLPGGAISGSNILSVTTNTSSRLEPFIRFGCTGCSGADTIYNCIGDPVSVIAFGNYSDTWIWSINGQQQGSNTNLLDTTRYWGGTGEIICHVTSHSTCIFPADTFTNSLYVKSTVDTPVITRTQNMLISSAAASYQWYLNDTLLAGRTGQSLGITRTGIYTVEISDPNLGCRIRTSYLVSALVGVDAVAADKILVYPSPTHSSLTVESAGTGQDMIIDDIYGHMVFTQKLTSAKQSIDIHMLPAAVYMVGVYTDAGIKFFKIVKE